MTTLIFNGSNGAVQKVELRGELSVGRTAGNDVVLDEQGVSRRHCRFFEAEDGQIWVEDLNSANGVLVDGARISEPTPVTEGSEVFVGGTSVTLEARRAVRRPSTGRPGANALAKREAGAPVRATRMMAAAEMPERGARPAARASGASRAGGDQRAKLTGNGGPWLGQVFQLNKARCVVGRTSPADVLLEDDSVSRKHAELYKTGSLVSVRDLGSANGTFVNGERITETQLANGDVVRFGVVELTYSGPGEAAAKPMAPKKKKLLILAGAGGAFLLALIAVASLGGGQPDPNTVGGGPLEAPPQTDDPMKLLGKCKAYADPDNFETLNWAKAVEVCEKVRELDPALTEAIALLRTAKKELSFEKVLEDAKMKVATSQDDLAIDLLTKIDTDSASFAKARAMFKEAADRVAKRSRTSCVTDFKSGLYAQAVTSCRRFLEVTCNLEGEDEKVSDMFHKSARSAGVSDSFTCPTAYARFGQQMRESSANQAELELRKRYTDPMVAMLMVRYFTTGKPKYVSDEFKRLRTKKARQYGNSLDDIILQLDIIDGRYTSGQEGILRGDPVLTESYWKDAFEADRRLIPEGLKSVMVKDMGRQLATGFYKIGWDSAQKSNYAEAFKSYYKGYQYDRTNQEILLQLAGMERHASSELKNSPGCESADLAMKITIPDGPVFKRAKEMKADYNCP